MWHFHHGRLRRPSHSSRDAVCGPAQTSLEDISLHGDLPAADFEAGTRCLSCAAGVCTRAQGVAGEAGREEAGESLLSSKSPFRQLELIPLGAPGDTQTLPQSHLWRGQEMKVLIHQHPASIELPNGQGMSSRMARHS